MPVHVTRTLVKAEHVPEVEEAAGRLYAAIRAARAAHVRVATSRLSDGQTFLTILHLDEGAANPLPALPAFQEFQATLRRCVAAPPVAEQATLVGAYRLFD